VSCKNQHKQSGGGDHVVAINWDEIRREYETTPISLSDLAEKYGIKYPTIKSRKQRQGWSKDASENSTDASHSQKDASKKKRAGPPLGNKNAAGHGAPKGNKNSVGNRGGNGGPPRNKKALKTGEYETIWLDALDDDERQLYEQIDTDPIYQADETIRMLSLRERRMLLRIQRLASGLTEKGRRVLQERKAIKDPIAVHDEKTGKTTVFNRERYELVITELEETETRAIEDILRIEEALTRVQDKKAKWVDLKFRMEAVDEEKQVRIEMMKIELQKLQGGVGATQNWTDALQEVAERRRKVRENE
jgi:uncharacterized protein YjcR